MDRAAKEAFHNLRIPSWLLHTSSDLRQRIRNLIKHQCYHHWNEQLNQHNKLLTVKPSPVPWSSSNRYSWRQEVIQARLRTGHTRLIHTHLLTNLILLSCLHCDFHSLTVDLPFSCSSFHHLRNTHEVPNNRTSALQNSNDLTSQHRPYRISIFLFIL